MRLGKKSEQYSNINVVAIIYANTQKQYKLSWIDRQEDELVGPTTGAGLVLAHHSYHPSRIRMNMIHYIRNTWAQCEVVHHCWGLTGFGKFSDFNGQTAELNDESTWASRKRAGQNYSRFEGKIEKWKCETLEWPEKECKQIEDLNCNNFVLLFRMFKWKLTWLIPNKRRP